MTNSTTTPAKSERATLAHVVTVPVLLGVFAVLMILTVLTISATWIDLGEWNLWIALGIATVKAALVALYFMHLRYDHPFNGLIFVTALLFLFLFLSLTMFDTIRYQPSIDSYQENLPR
jgi:cytochrome c oxidase subunit 4